MTIFVMTNWFLMCNIVHGSLGEHLDGDRTTPKMMIYDHWSCAVGSIVEHEHRRHLWKENAFITGTAPVVGFPTLELAGNVV
ncbi:hypothetical protein M5689_021668 [Euphorbia peplus]|nr:hypothetical protein M5689_021668 [Euphorbia peplus]